MHTICLHIVLLWLHQGPVSLSDKTFYCNISQSLEASRFVLRIIRSLRNLTGISAGLPTCQISKRYEHFNTLSIAFETLWYFTIRSTRVTWYHIVRWTFTVKDNPQVCFRSYNWLSLWHFELYGSYCRACAASDMGLSASVPLPIVMGIFVLLGFQSS